MKLLSVQMLCCVLLTFIAAKECNAQGNISATQVQEFEELAKKSESSGNLNEAAKYLNKLAYFYWDKQDYSSSMGYFEKSLNLSEKLGNKNSIAVINCNLGIINSDQKNYQAAIPYFEKSLSIRKEMRDKAGEVSQMINIGMTLQSMKNYSGSIEKLERALEMAKELNNVPLMKNCYHLLAEDYDKLGNTTKSFEYFNFFSALDKQDQKKEIQKTKEELQALSAKELEEEKIRLQKEKELEEKNQKLQATENVLHQTEEASQERSVEIDILNKDKELKDESIHEKDNLIKTELYTIYLIIVCSVLMAVLAIVSFRNFREKSKANQLLHKQAEEIKEQSANLEKALAEIKDKSDKIKGSITYAQRIQGAMLPSQERLRGYFPDSFIFFRPRDIVSGDFYWIGEDEKSEGDPIVAVCDCTGHGVPGAFMSMLGHNFLDVFNQRGVSSTNQLLDELHVGIRNALHQDTTDNRDGMDAAICKYKRKEKTIEFSGAKNSVYYIKDNQLSEIKGDVTAIGGIQKEAKRIFSKHEIIIDQPTTFYLFSDGYPDQFGGELGKKFMYSKLKELLLQIHTKSMDEQQQILGETMDKWQNNKHRQIDDMLIIGFKVA
jgi:serine phosphatase RsbU (regulator of sigma subunit)